MKNGNGHVYEFGPYRLDTGQRLLIKGGSEVKVPMRSFELLSFLATRANEVIDKETLIAEVWAGSFVEESNLSVHVSNLRKIFAEANGDAGVNIETFPKVGYRFNADVRHVPRIEASVVTADPVLSTNGHSPAVELLPNQTYVPRSKARAALFLVIPVVLVAGGYLLSQRLGQGANSSISIARVPGTEQSSTIAISPDGQYLAHAISRGGKRTLTMTHISSGSSGTTLLPADESLYLGLTFTPDGRQLYFVKAGPEFNTLYRMPFLGGNVEKVLEPLEQKISFSPDASRFCFVRKLPGGISALMTADVDGKDEREVARRAAPAAFSGFSISWSPDGRTIANAATSGQGNPGTQLIGIDTATGTESLLSPKSWAGADGLEWLRDGTGLIAALWEGQTARTNVWRIGYPDGELRQITTDLENYGTVGVSADGKTILTGQFRDVTSVWLVPAGSPERAAPVNASKYHRFAWVRWMGNEGFVFGSDAGKQRDVWRMNIDGTGERMLTNGPQSNVMPVATADESYIVFAAFRDNNGLFELWRMNSDGSDQTQLTSGQGAWQPALTPDGKWALYTSGKMAGPDMERRVWKVPVDGGEAVQMFDKPAYQPTVSPDGKFFACWTKAGEKAKPQVAIIPIEGGEPIKLLDTPEGNRIDWTPDGKGISYVKAIGGVSNVWTQPLDGGPARQETSFAAETIENFDWSPDGRLICSRFTKERDTVLIRNFR